MKKRYRKGVFIVTYIKHNNKIIYLLLKRKLHWKGWEFPKGGVEDKENLINTIKRELMEETGQKSNKLKSFNKKGNYLYDKQYQDRKGFIGQSYKLFSAEVINKKIILDKREHSDYKWMDFDKAWVKLNWPNQKICLNVVNNYLKKR